MARHGLDSKRSSFLNNMKFDLRHTFSRLRSKSRSHPRVLEAEEPSHEPEKSLQPVSNDPACRNAVAFALNNSVKPGGPSSSSAGREQSGPEDHAVRIRADPTEPKTLATSGQPSAVKAANDGQAKPSGSDGAETTARRSQPQDADQTSEPPQYEAAGDNADIWSVAYHDAIQKLDREKRDMVLTGRNLNQLLKDLEERDAESAENSYFRKGLKRVQKPLENVKLAVDLAQPLLGLDPAVATATGVVKSFTIAAVSICGASKALTDKIAEMLQQASVIGECDQVGQELGPASTTIHDRLVQVYTQLLEFYIAAMRFFSHGSMVLRIMSEAVNDRLSSIVTDFLSYADLLHQSIDNAVAKLTADISRLLLDNKIKNLLGVEEEARRSGNHSSIQKVREDKACSWITQDSDFNRWYSAPGSGFLVLFGAMGCGKTVTTAYVIDHLIHLNDNTVFGHLVCYHYCNTDETSGTIYIYSSILQQLFNQRPGLKIKFDTWYESTRRDGCIDPTKSSPMLGKFIAECVKSLGRTLIVVIDAIDECSNQSLSELLALLKDIAEGSNRLKVFLSSRPGEEIEGMLRGAAQITLCRDPERDAIVVDHLVSNNLGELTEEIRSLVVRNLRDSADGSMIWIKLTVDLIRTRRISAYSPMKSLLRGMPLPPDLSNLYSQLFKEVTEGDDENMVLAGTALEILAVTRRPLSILELGWAAALMQFSEFITPETTVHELASWVDEKRVLSLIQQFLSQVDSSDPRKPQLKLAHHSLKTLILRREPSAWQGARNLDSMTRFGKTGMEPRQAELEARLLGTCVRYLLLQGFDDDKTKLLPEDNEWMQARDALPQGDGLFEDDVGAPEDNADAAETAEPMYYSPSARGFGEFFVYASCYWLEHFQAAPTEQQLPDISDIVNLCRAKSVRLRNWVDQYCRPDCTVLPKFNWEAAHLDPLVITSTFGPPAAVEAILRDYDLAGSQFVTESIAAAVQNMIYHKKISQLHSFFRQERIGLTPQTLPLYMKAMREWTNPGLGGCDFKARDRFFDLVRDAVPLLLTNCWGNELLCSAAAAGCLPVIESLFDEARSNPALHAELLRDRQRQDNPGCHDKHQSVGEAVWNNQVEVVRYLIKQPGIETHLRHRDLGGYNVISKAARFGNPEIVRMLVKRYPEGVDQEDMDGDAPMIEFLNKHSSVDAVKALLEAGGADPNRGNGWKSTLRVAVRHGDVEVCRALVEKGADPGRALRFDKGRAVGLADIVDNAEVEQKLFDMFCELGEFRKADNLQL